MRATCGVQPEEARALLQRSISQVEALSASTREQLLDMITRQYRSTWRAKFDLDAPCNLPAIHIELEPGAKPARIRRHYNFNQEQRAFLREHLRHLQNTDIISRIESPWC